MQLKKFVISVLAGSLSMWLLAGLWHKVIMAQYYAAVHNTTHEGTGIILTAYLILGIFMAYLYPLVYKGGRPTVEGLKFGMIIGLLWVFPHELLAAGAHGSSISYVLKNAVLHMFEQGIGGIIIGIIYGRQLMAEKS
jgi:hypothetical protein